MASHFKANGSMTGTFLSPRRRNKDDECMGCERNLQASVVIYFHVYGHLFLKNTLKIYSFISPDNCCAPILSHILDIEYVF